MEKIAVDVVEMMETIYSDLSTDQIIADINWLDDNTEGWLFDRIRMLAVTELANR